LIAEAFGDREREFQGEHYSARRNVMVSRKCVQRLLLAAACAGAVCPQWSAADDPQPQRKTQVQSRSGGMIRIVGPDGQVQERRFGDFAGPDHDALLKKLKELQAAAGDREAVERISKELLESMQKQAPLQARVPGVDAGLPTYGIGVSLAQEVPAALQKQLKLDEDGGVLVQSVAADGPAAKAGLQEFDVILAVDGKPITLAASLVDAVQKAGENQKPVSLAVVSGGEHKTIEVTPSKSEQIEWKLGEGGGAAGGIAGEANRFHFGDELYPPPMIDLRIPPGMMMPHLRMEMKRQPNGVMKLVPQDAELNERIEKLEAELKELNAKLDKLAEKQ
jgi:membrane-associated protease RseP (regulator of RpoE activity)